MNVSDSQLDEIKIRTDLAELISSYGVNLRRSGSGYMACCPFHHEKTPSFSIDPNKGLYHCFGCGESGTAISFVQKYEGLSFPDAVRKLAERVGVKLEEREDPEAGKRKRLYALMAELSQFYHRCLVKTKEAQIARDYLKGRDFDENIWDEFQIGYAVTGAANLVKWGEKYGYTPEELELAGVLVRHENRRPGDFGYNRFGGRLMFTICDRQGRVVAFSGRQLVENKKSGKYVNSPETLIFKKSNVLYMFDRASGNIVRSPHREIILCEGQIDTIRLHINGFKNAVASQGTAFTDEHAKMIKKVADSALLMYDDDAAGHKATVKVAGMLLKMEMPVRVVSLPNGDDPDSYLRHHSAAELQSLIDNAESIISFQCRTDKAKEKNPDSIDAVSRVSKAVLSTISVCPNAILRSTMIGETAKLLGLPVAALAEELERERERLSLMWENRIITENPPQSSPDDVVEMLNSSGEDAGKVAPPGKAELDFLSYIIAHDSAAPEIAAMIREYLPVKVFSHDFTRKFISLYLDAVEKGGASFEPFDSAFEGHEVEWNNIVLKDSQIYQDAYNEMRIRERVRIAWEQFFKTKCLSMPSGVDPAIDDEKLTLTGYINNLVNWEWNDVTNLIEQFKKEYIENGP